MKMVGHNNITGDRVIFFSDCQSSYTPDHNYLFDLLIAAIYDRKSFDKLWTKKNYPSEQGISFRTSMS